MGARGGLLLAGAPSRPGRRLRRRRDAHRDRHRGGARPGDGDDGATAAPAGEPRALAEGTGALSGRPFTFRVAELRRSGATVVLNATLILDEDAEGGIHVGDLFGDGIDQPLEGRRARREPADVFDGIAMIDPDNRRQYLIARDADGGSERDPIGSEPGGGARDRRVTIDVDR